MRRVAHAASSPRWRCLVAPARYRRAVGNAAAPPPLPAAVADRRAARRACGGDRGRRRRAGRERVVLGHLSRKLGMSAEALRAQRAQSGLGWGDLLIANRLSLETHAPFEALVAEMRAAGTGERRARARRRPRAAGERRAHLGRDRRTARRGQGPHATTVPGSGKATAAAVADALGADLTMDDWTARGVGDGRQPRLRPAIALPSGRRAPTSSSTTTRAHRSGRGRDGDREGGRRALAMKADVASEREVRAMIEATLEALRPSRHPREQRGYHGPRRLRRTPIAAYERMFATNVTGTMLCTRAALPAMIERTYAASSISVAARAHGSRHRRLRRLRGDQRRDRSAHARAGLTRSASTGSPSTPSRRAASTPT